MCPVLGGAFVEAQLQFSVLCGKSWALAQRIAKAEPPMPQRTSEGHQMEMVSSEMWRRLAEPSDGMRGTCAKSAASRVEPAFASSQRLFPSRRDHAIFANVVSESVRKLI